MLGLTPFAVEKTPLRNSLSDCDGDGMWARHDEATTGRRETDAPLTDSSASPSCKQRFTRIFATPRSPPATMSTAAVDPLSQTPLAFVEINGARLAYRIAGNPSDPLIITLHGGRGFGMYSTRGVSLAKADVLRRFA